MPRLNKKRPRSYSPFLELLERRRLAKGWDKTTLALKAKRPRHQIYDLLTGKTAAPDVVKDVAKALGIDVEQVWKGEAA